MDSDSEIDVQSQRFGLKTLVDGRRPDIDIIAVHGFGAYPAKAWTRKVKHANKKSTFVNWLSDPDMLPSQLPNARIMTFNYDSKWYWNAIKQTTVNLGTQLLNAIFGYRQKEPLTKWRPIIFIGHSYGGIVIEQCIVASLLNNSIDPKSFNLVASVAGFIFLGAPLRGSAATKLGRYIATTVGFLGGKSEQSVLNDLQMDSPNLEWLLSQFSQWLYEQRVPTWCFYEQYETDYGERYGMLFGSQMIVEPSSACIDGAQRQGLATNHLNINKFSGPRDACYVDSVLPQLLQLAKEAKAVVSIRRNPRSYRYDQHDVRAADQNCIRSLFHGLRQPIDELTRLTNSKGEHAKDTCHWIENEENWIRWLYTEGSILLLLIGELGIGKTMISIHVVKRLIHHVKLSSHEILFAFFFCDRARRYGAADVVRSYIVQLVQQRPGLCDHLQPDFQLQGDGLRENFEALHRLISAMIQDTDTPPCILLLDGLDECDVTVQSDICRMFRELLHTTRNSTIKILISSRPTHAAKYILGEVNISIYMQPHTIAQDLQRYVDQQISLIKRSNMLLTSVADEISQALSERNGGTFLWISFIFQEISHATTASEMLLLISRLPKSLYEVYDRILDDIHESRHTMAIRIFRTLQAVGNELSKEDFAMLLCIMNPETVGLPSSHQVRGMMNCHEYGGDLIKIVSSHSTTFNTIAFVHASVNEYFDSDHLKDHQRLSRYYCNTSECRVDIFKYICKFRKLAMDYLNSKERSEDKEPVAIWLSEWNWYRRDRHDLYHYHLESYDWRQLQSHDLLEYCGTLDMMPLAFYSTLHKMEANIPGFSTQLTRIVPANSSPELIEEASQIIREHRDPTLLVMMVFHESLFWSRFLFEMSYTSFAWSLLGLSPLVAAATRNNTKMLSLFLEYPESSSKWYSYQYRMGEIRQALIEASRSGSEAAVAFLLDHPDVDVSVVSNDVGDSSETPLHAALYHPRIFSNILSKGACIDEVDARGNTFLHVIAAETDWPERGRQGYLMIRLLLEAGLSAETRNNAGMTALMIASMSNRVDSARELLNHGADIDAQDPKGLTAFSIAAKFSAFEVLDFLELKGADMELVDHAGRTALMQYYSHDYQDVDHDFLGQDAYEETGGTLIATSNISYLNAQDNEGRTALSYAAESLACYITQESSHRDVRKRVDLLIFGLADPFIKDYTYQCPRSRFVKQFWKRFTASWHVNPVAGSMEALKPFRNVISVFPATSSDEIISWLRNCHYNEHCHEALQSVIKIVRKPQYTYEDWFRETAALRDREIPRPFVKMARESRMMTSCPGSACWKCRRLRRLCVVHYYATLRYPTVEDYQSTLAKRSDCSELVWAIDCSAHRFDGIGHTQSDIEWETASDESELE